MCVFIRVRGGLFACAFDNRCVGLVVSVCLCVWLVGWFVVLFVVLVGF